MFSPRVRAKPQTRRPVTTPKSAGVGSVFVIGAVIAVVGRMIDVWWLFLFGAMSVAAAAGGGIAMWLEGRRYTEDEAAS